MHVTEAVRVAAEAWRKVKPADDPDFNNCALSHRETLICKVERVAASGGVSDDFEKAVKEILDLQLKAPEPAATTESAPATTQDAAPATEKKTRRSKKSK